MIEELKQYLHDTACSGSAPARVEAIYELAPNVFLVLDWFQGQLEYDVYYANDAIRSSKEAGALIKGKPWTCHGWGRFPGSLENAVQGAKLFYEPIEPWFDRPIARFSKAN